MEGLLSGISSVLTWLVDTTLYISILICLILLLKAIMRRRLPAWWHYGLWLLLVARMLMPWVPESRLSMFNYVPLIAELNTYMPTLMELDLNLPPLTELNFTEGIPESSQKYETDSLFWQDLTLDRVLLPFWFAGMIVIGVAVVLKNLSFWLIIKRVPLITDQKILGLLEICKSRLKIQTVVDVIMTDKIKGPALFGYLRPRLLLPKGILEKLNEDQLRYVFLHELGHLKRHDIAISWLTTVLQTIHWFNPLVWYAFYQMRVDQESACDAYVLSRIKPNQSTGYANTIVGLLESFYQNRQLPALVGILENKSQIRRRLIMIAQNKKYSRKLTFLAVSLLISICFIFFTSAQGLSIEGKSKTEGRSQLSPTMQPVLDIAASPETGKAQQAEREKVPKLPTEALKALYEAQTLMDEEKWDEAIARLDAYLATRPPDVPAAVHIAIGNCWYYKENYEETRKAFEKAYEIDPSDVKVLANYANITYQTERFVEAAGLWEELYGMQDPPKSKTLYQAAAAYYQGEDLRNSKSVMERLLRLPGTPPERQWYQLIIDLCFQLEDMGEAEGYILDFLRLNPVQATYWKMLSQIQLDKNDLLSGARSLEMALSIQPPNNKNGWRILAELYRSAGEIEKAAHYFEKAGVTKEEDARFLPEGKSLSREEPFSLSEVDIAPQITRRVLPIYPYDASLKGLKGWVMIDCVVGTDGLATDIKAVEADPEDILEIFGPPCVEAVRKYVFSPGKIAGEPVPTRVKFRIIFELGEESDEKPNEVTP
jgi:bla regulator protein BlaR1